jgi:uncharacterized membrane protein YkvA (DUF1232 family)
MKFNIYPLYRQALQSKWKWVFVVLTVLYFINPFDIIPDIIPLVGWIDDGLLVSILVAELIRNRNLKPEPKFRVDNGDETQKTQNQTNGQTVDAEWNKKDR